ncbi:hypothetical protein ACFYYB_41495 [Streptomyces sp. NPDC002886]|uniref:hypothetical protein n=1 Tax=Streptomyces sp. NPDC002886 TaxID=3364667 RepID=UPI003685FD16
MGRVQLEADLLVGHGPADVRAARVVLRREPSNPHGSAVRTTTGMAQSEIGDWLAVLADHLKQSIETGDAPQPSSPRTHGEWHARFPETAQLVGELGELLALPLDEGDYALAAAELGMEVGPPDPFSYGTW